MERDLDKALSEKVFEFITKAVSEKSLVDRVESRFNKSILNCHKAISKYKAKIEKEEIGVQETYEEYSLGKIDREKYSLKREIALSHIDTINNEVVAVENIVANENYTGTYVFNMQEKSVVTSGSFKFNSKDEWG